MLYRIIDSRHNNIKSIKQGLLYSPVSGKIDMIFSNTKK